MKKYKFIDKSISFADKKVVVSVRDGYQEYHTSEIGMEGDRVVKIYRKPESILAIVDAMVNLPITHNHIDMDGGVPDTLKIGKVVTSEARPMQDNQYEGTIEIQNSIEANLEGIESRELSLGYFAKLDPYKDGFIQSDFQVHHLAIVDAGRCGKSCKFVDGKSFKSEYATILNQNKKESQMDILELFKSLDANAQKTFIDEAGIQTTVFKDKKIEVPAKVTAQMKKEFGDDAISKFLDSKEFADAQLEENEKYARTRVAVIEKAKNFLDADYKFDDKANDAIMADAVRAELSDVEFADEEIPTAFKTLKVLEKKTADVVFTDADKEMQKLADEEY